MVSTSSRATMSSAVTVEPEPPEPPDLLPSSRDSACPPLLAPLPLLVCPLLVTSPLLSSPPPLLADPLIRLRSSLAYPLFELPPRELRHLRSSLAYPLFEPPPRELRHLRSWLLCRSFLPEYNSASRKAYFLQSENVEMLPDAKTLPVWNSRTESLCAKPTVVLVQAPSAFRQGKIVSKSSQSRTKKIDIIPSALETMVLAMSSTLDFCLGILIPSSNQTLVWVLDNRCEPPDPPVPPDTSWFLFSTGYIVLNLWNYVELTGLSPIARVDLFRLKFLSPHLPPFVVIRLVLSHLLPLNEDHLTALCRSLPLYEDHFTALCRPLPRIEDHFTALCRPLPRIEDLDTLPLYEDFVTLPLYEDFGSFVEFFTPLYSPFVSNDCVARSVITGSFVRCLIASVAILEIGNCALVAVPISGVRSSTQDFTLLNNSIVEEIRGLLQDLYLFKCYVVIIPFSFSTYVIVISAYYALVVMLSTNTYSIYGV